MDVFMCLAYSHAGNTFFSRLPGLAACDLISAKLLKMMTEDR